MQNVLERNLLDLIVEPSEPCENRMRPVLRVTMTEDGDWELDKNGTLTYVKDDSYLDAVSTIFPSRAGRPALLSPAVGLIAFARVSTRFLFAPSHGFVPLSHQVIAQIPTEYLNRVVAFEVHAADDYPQLIEGTYYQANTVLYCLDHQG